MRRTARVSQTVRSRRAYGGGMTTTAPQDDVTFTMSAADARALRDELQRFLLEYRFGLQEVETKIAILRDEFLHMHSYNPIEHVSGRVKSIDSLVAKVRRKGVSADLASIRESITDVAGIRITCSFVADAYRLF